MAITDRYIEKNGKQIKKVSLLYVDESTRLCDGCDEQKKCTSIISIHVDISFICKDYLIEIKNNINEDTD